jgi:hypothetical protein
MKWPLDGDATAFEIADRAIDVFAHEIDLLAGVSSLGWMDSQLARREGEDEPAASGVYRVEAEYILEESAIRVRVVAEDERVSAIDHVASGLSLGSRKLTRRAMLR